jgi:hypothetical protein
MKRKSLFVLLGCESVLLVARAILTSFNKAAFSSIPAFPFEQIADGLKALSQAGKTGSGLALALWIGISLIPSLFALKAGRGKETTAERVSLFILSGVLLVSLYGMINPGVFSPLSTGFQTGFIPVIKAVLGVCIWSVIVLYIILRMLRSFRSGDIGRLLKYLRIVLFVLCAFFTAAIFVTCAGELIAALKETQKGLDAVFAVLRFFAASVPYVSDVIITVSAIGLLDTALGEDRAGIVGSAEKLGRACCIALGITAASTACFNVLQMILMRRLSDIDAGVDIPVVSIAFTLIVLLVARLLAENKRLRDDNDMFI